MPAYEAMRATLGDAELDLATMDPAASLWQAGASVRGVSSGTFYGRFRRYLTAAGLAPTGLHALRHTAAKLRRDAGESIEAASAFLDHSSLAVTTVYLRRLEGCRGPHVGGRRRRHRCVRVRVDLVAGIPATCRRSALRCRLHRR
jgi:hypothetical protein